MSKEGLAALKLAVAEVKSVITTLSDEEWSRPSGCQGWSVRDLVAHMSSNYKETVDPSPPPAEPINLPAERMMDLLVDARDGWTNQQILDEYKAGIEITQVQLRGVEPPAQVIDAFRDVQRAQADRERLRNEAESYRNQIVPEARGQSQRIVQEAEAYRQQVLAQAQGEAQRFTSIYDAYRLAPEVTKRRLYLEMMEEMLAKTNKVIVDQPQGGTGVMPFLPLQDLLRRQQQQQQPGQPAGARP